MKKLNSLFFLTVFFSNCFLFSSTISLDEAEKLGEKIWKNECGGKIQGLTSWNEREGFASMGIGHFIWYPENHKEPFEEMFPSFLRFLEEKNVSIPDFLQTSKVCPWSSKKEFDDALDSKKMQEIRKTLIETKGLQVLFMVTRLEKTLEEIKQSLSGKKQEDVMKVLNLLTQNARGLYALIDYLNFKGSGLVLSESYAGNRWGLLQILEQLSPQSNSLLEDFVSNAKALLLKRVEYAPPERKEEKYIKGWFNRLDTYLKN